MNEPVEGRTPGDECCFNHCGFEVLRGTASGWCMMFYVSPEGPWWTRQSLDVAVEREWCDNVTSSRAEFSKSELGCLHGFPTPTSSTSGAPLSLHRPFQGIQEIVCQWKGLVGIPFLWRNRLTSVAGQAHEPSVRCHWSYLLSLTAIKIRPKPTHKISAFLVRDNWDTLLFARPPRCEFRNVGGLSVYVPTGTSAPPLLRSLSS